MVSLLTSFSLLVPKTSLSQMSSRQTERMSSSLDSTKPVLKILGRMTWLSPPNNPSCTIRFTMWSMAVLEGVHTRIFLSPSCFCDLMQWYCPERTPRRVDVLPVPGGPCNMMIPRSLKHSSLMELSCVLLNLASRTWKNPSNSSGWSTQFLNLNIMEGLQMNSAKSSNWTCRMARNSLMNVLILSQNITQALWTFESKAEWNALLSTLVWTLTFSARSSLVSGVTRQPRKRNSLPKSQQEMFCRDGWGVELINTRLYLLRARFFRAWGVTPSSCASSIISSTSKPSVGLLWKLMLTLMGFLYPSELLKLRQVLQREAMVSLTIRNSKILMYSSQLEKRSGTFFFSGKISSEERFCSRIILNREEQLLY